MAELQPLLLPWLDWTVCVYLLLAGLRCLDGGPARRRITMSWAAVISVLIVGTIELGGQLVGA